MLDQLYQKLYEHFWEIELQKPELSLDLYQKPSQPLANPLDIIKDKISSALEVDEDVVDFPSVKWPDLVVDTKKVWELKESEFDSIKQVADWIFEKLQSDENLLKFVEVKQLGIFVNLYLKDAYLEHFLEGWFQTPWAKRLIVDYASPNVAKQMTVGHLRSSVIGQSLANIHQLLGWQVLRWNYIWDWWTPFGKLIFAFEKLYQWFEAQDPDLKKVVEKWGRGDKLIENFLFQPVDVMADLYAAFRLLPFENKDDKAREYFALLDRGDDRIVYLWKVFRYLSIEKYKQVFKKLGIEFDLWWGEAFAQQYVGQIIEMLQKAGYVSSSQGALVVYFKKQNQQWVPLKNTAPTDDQNVEVMLLKKQDGTTLYATRDLATLWLRLTKLEADKILYVVWAEQSLHFELLFALAKDIWWIDKVEVKHVEFGLMLMGGEKMSSRKGNVVYLEDLITNLEDNILQEFEDKIDKETASKLAVASLIFNDLKSDRIKNIDFDPQKIIKLNWDTGTYILYGYVRLKNLLMKLNPAQEVDLNHLTDAEKSLLKKISFGEEVLSRASKINKPHLIAQFLLEIVKEFNSWYSNSPKIVEMELEIQRSKCVFLASLHQGFLRLMEALNLPVVTKM